MAYTPNTFELVGEFPLTQTARAREFWYDTTDDLSAVIASGYFTDASNKGARAGDLVWVINRTNPTVNVLSFSSVTAGGAGTAQLSTLAGGGIANFRNLIDGGDFTVNPWQRGTSFSSIANTLTYTADRFFAVGGASSSISVSKQTQTDVPGFNNSLRFGRGGGTNTATINLGQVMESADSFRCQGQQVTLSFWAKAGAQFSAAGGKLTVQVSAATTGSDDTAAHLVAASTNWPATPQVINSTVVLTQTAQRFQLTGTVPLTATQLGVLFSYAPTGTNNSTDTVDFYGIQLEIAPAATPFEHRDVQVELEICQRYFYQLGEPATGAQVTMGAPTGTNTQSYMLPLPVQMRNATLTVVVTVGSFKVVVDGAAAAAATGLTNGSAHTPNAVSLNSTVTLSAAAHSILLQGGGGVGLISVSADY